MKRNLAIVLTLLAGIPALLPAQYFGQNKVQYRTFNFQVIQTEHFDVYFYERERAAAVDAARMAERGYARLSRALNHQFRERKPILLYASHTDFQQTNATGGEVSEGTRAFADFLKHRIVIPFTGSYPDFEQVFQHEMVHQFQYDIWSRGRAGANIQALIALNPPLWFVEGMAEYFSKGEIDANTAMWLRDAALEGDLPTIEQLSNDPRIFPYRFGEALLAYIGERWGDEAIGAILHSSLGGNLEGAFRRVLGLGFEELSNQWRDAVQKKYLPEIGNRVRASAFAKPVLTEAKSDGTLHLAPALSPDGTQIAYFSEKDFYFVDLYLADATTGRVERRLLKSAFSANYESFRFINSGVSWSPDGHFIAMAAKKGPKDDLVIVDVARHREVKRIKVDLNGITNPSWSPDGRQIVFTGYDGGLSDLYVVNADGSGFRRLTDDKYADFHPAWSPDGKSIAFSTDRGPKTSFDSLTFSNMRIALFHLERGTVEVLPRMEEGKNVSPQWAPDGRQIAFTSDRNGVTNIYLYDLDDRQIYQLTDLFTGVQGITPLSPALSWARKVDRIAFVYYEDEKYDVYTLDDPRSLRKPYRPAPLDERQVAEGPARSPAQTPDSPPAMSGAVREGGSIYRSDGGFRESGQARADSTAPKPISISALLDSAALNLPDTSEFTIKKHRVKFTPDYIARPSVGYARDTFGRGFFGGTAISLSDMLGDQTLVFSGYVNGSLAESQILAAYINLRRRVNWAIGAGQEPYFFREATIIKRDPSPAANDTLVTNVRRLVVRSAFAEAYYPLNRFRRIELGMRLANVSDDRLSLVEPFNGLTGSPDPGDDPFIREQDLGSSNYVQPSLAMVFDNSLMGYVGPFYGKRYRFSISQSVGTWNFTTATVDYRRYDKLFGPFTLATRGLYFGRIGRDADQFQIYLGGTDLLRGNTSGSYFRHECNNSQDLGSLTGCNALDRLVGTQIATASAELRFPVANSAMFRWLPLGFPPLEGALFYDVGVAWDENSTVRLNGNDNGDPLRFRTPLQTVGASLRTNLFNFVILRLDYSIPLHRDGVRGLWTLSLGPTF